jgi:hypothetical protein
MYIGGVISEEEDEEDRDEGVQSFDAIVGVRNAARLHCYTRTGIGTEQGRD